MLRSNPAGDRPFVDPTAVIDPTAIICGKVTVEARVFIGPYAVLRCDEHDGDGSNAGMIIGAGTNIQDGVVIHSLAGAAVRIGQQVSLAHRAVIHGPVTIGDGCFVGFNSVVVAALLGPGGIVRHGCVVEQVSLPAGMEVPSGEALVGAVDPGRVRAVDDAGLRFASEVVQTNQALATGYTNTSFD